MMSSNKTEDVKLDLSIAKVKNESKEKRKNKKKRKMEKKQSEADTTQLVTDVKNVAEIDPNNKDQMKGSPAVDTNQEQLKEKKKRKRKSKRQLQEDKCEEQPEQKSSKKRKMSKEKPGPSDHKKTEEASNQHQQEKLRSDQLETKPSHEEKLSADDEEHNTKSAMKDEDASKEEEIDIPQDDERMQRTLFVGNVAQNTTRKDIRKLFQQYGEIESVRIRNVIAVNPKIPKKVALLSNRLAKFADSFSAYVVFKSQDNLETILKKACKEQNMVLFMEKHLRVMLAIQNRLGPRRQSIFVGNLPFDCSEEELIEAFKPIAEGVGVNLLNVRVNRDRDTGVGRGVGFVSFDDDLGVQASLNNVGNISIRNRDVRVERAMKTKNMKSKSYKSRRNQHFQRSTGQ